MADELAVVVVSHNSARDLESTLAALCDQMTSNDELIVVDNASVDGTPAVARGACSRASVIEVSANLGFAGGCHVGAQASTAPLLLFLNPDAFAEPGCLDALRACAREREHWGAWQALVAMADRRRVNTAGNEVHFLGFGWAGRCGDPVGDVDKRPNEVGFASGAALVVRREAWNAVGGFDKRYFMYGEDLDLSLRLRLAGWGVGIAPAAIVAHDYDFSKGDYKWFYLERNRWWTLIGDYPARLLILLTPALAIFEMALLVVAWRGGWLRAKIRAQYAVVRSLGAIVRRRRAIQATRVMSDRVFAEHLTASLDSPYLRSAAQLPGLRAAQAVFWRAALAVLR